MSERRAEHIDKVDDVLLCGADRLHRSAALRIRCDIPVAGFVCLVAGPWEVSLETLMIKVMAAN